jgi:hypothetical protein
MPGWREHRFGASRCAPGTIQFTCRILDARVGVRAVIKRGKWVHYVEVAAPPAAWTGAEATLRTILRSYVPKKD